VMGRGAVARPCAVVGRTYPVRRDNSPRIQAQYHRRDMSAITDLFAGVSGSDLDAGIEWYTRPEPPEEASASPRSA
jgi:hypothetical protein